MPRREPVRAGTRLGTHRASGKPPCGRLVRAGRPFGAFASTLRSDQCRMRDDARTDHGRPTRACRWRVATSADRPRASLARSIVSDIGMTCTGTCRTRLYGDSHAEVFRCERMPFARRKGSDCDKLAGFEAQMPCLSGSGLALSKGARIEHDQVASTCRIAS